MYGSLICTVDHSVAKFKVAAVAKQVAQILLKFFQIQDFSKFCPLQSAKLPNQILHFSGNTDLHPKGVWVKI